ncbi:unnamed protein product, partial [Tilletia controversa]
FNASAPGQRKLTRMKRRTSINSITSPHGRLDAIPRTLT